MKLPTVTLIAFAATAYTLEVCPKGDTKCLEEHPSAVPVDKLRIPFTPTEDVEPIGGWDLKIFRKVWHPKTATATRATPSPSDYASAGDKLEPRRNVWPPVKGLNDEPNRHLRPYPIKHTPSMTTIVATAMPAVAGPIEKRDDAICTTTIPDAQGQEWLDIDHPVKTMYSTTVTASLLLDCGGCELEVVPNEMDIGVGPQVRGPLGLTTVAVTTTTLVGCLPSEV
jgi:hypothetical protein